MSMSQCHGIILRIAAGLVALLLFAMAPVLFMCAEGWWRKLGAIPGIGFGIVFAMHAIGGRRMRDRGVTNRRS